MKARNALQRRGDGRRRVSWWALAAAAILILVLPSAASAKTSRKKEKITTEEKEEFAIFKACPLTEAVACVYSVTNSGEFIIGSKTVPISKPILLQGGVAGEFDFLPVPMIAAVGAETMQKVPEEVPGGLVGIAGLGGEVTATAELAGPVSSVILNAWSLAFMKSESAVTLPLKVKLSNEVLGENCYIGSDEEPIVLNLTAGKTKPPSGVEPIEGGHEIPVGGTKAGLVSFKKLKLVDNTFSVPGAQGCGNSLDSAVIDQLLDTDIGLPSAAGKNTVIMMGETKEAEVKHVVEYLPKEKEKKKKKEKKT